MSFNTLFDPVELGFLWPKVTDVTNAYDESMTITPNGWKAGFDEADEAGRMSLRLYETPRGDMMTENEVAAWLCGGSVAWLDILKAIHEIVGDNKPMNVTSLHQQMLRLGVSKAAFELTLLRLTRGGHAKVEGEGNARTVTITKW